MMAKQSALNPKLVQKSKEKAIQDAEKNIKLFEKIQRKATKKAERKAEKEERNRKKLYEPIQVTNQNNRLQPVEYSTLKTGTLKWSISQKNKGDIPLKFSDLVLVNNTNGVQRTNQFNSLLANVKGTLTNSTSSRLVRSLGAVSRKVQLKKQVNNSDELNDEEQKQQVEDNNQNSQLILKNNLQKTASIKSNLINNNNNNNPTTIRSLTGLCRDTDVLYVVRKEPVDYGIIDYNKLNDCIINTNKIKKEKKSKGEEEEETEKNKELKEEELNNSKSNSISNKENKTSSLKNNNSIKSLDNNNNLDKTKFKLKDLFQQQQQVKLIQTTTNDNNNENTTNLYSRNNNKVIKQQNSINNKILNSGLTRTTSESNILFELRKGESNLNNNSTISSYNQIEKIKLKNLNKSQMIQSTTKLNSLNSSVNSNSLNSFGYIRPGFGSLVFRQNLFTQVLQLSKQLNEDNYIEQDRLDNNNIKTFKSTLNNKIKSNHLNNNNSNNNNNNRILTIQKSTTNQHTNRLQLIQKINKQLRNSEENDSIGNSVESSLSSRSTNSSTNSTLSSNLIETELTDDLNMKLSSKNLLFKTRKSLKLIEQQQSVNQHEIKNNNQKEELMNNNNNDDKEMITNNSNSELNKQQVVIDNQKLKKLDNQVNVVEKIKVVDQILDKSELNVNQVKNFDKKDEVTEVNNDKTAVKDDKKSNMIEEKEEVVVTNQDNQLKEKNCVNSEKNLDDKINENEKRIITTKKYFETYEKLNRQTLNRCNDTLNKNKMNNNKLYLKKNDKLKIKDKFLNRQNSRLEEERTNNNNNKEINSINNSLNDSLNDSLDDSSNKNLKLPNSLLNKHHQINNNQLDDLEDNWNQDAGTEIAIEKISTHLLYTTTTESVNENKISNSTIPIENKIKKFEKLNNNNCSNDDTKNENLKDSSNSHHVYKLVVKNRELNELNELDKNSKEEEERKNSLSTLTSTTILKAKSPPSSNLQSSSSSFLTKTTKTNLTTSNLPLNTAVKKEIITTNLTLNTSSKLPITTSSSSSSSSSTINNNTTLITTTNLTLTPTNNFSNSKNSKTNYENKDSIIFKQQQQQQAKRRKSNIELFLSNQNLEEFVDLFEKKKINFLELMELDENDLTFKIGLPLDASKKLINAISQRNTTLKLTSTKDLEDTCL